MPEASSLVSSSDYYEAPLDQRAEARREALNMSDDELAGALRVLGRYGWKGSEVLRRAVLLEASQRLQDARRCPLPGEPAA